VTPSALPDLLTLGVLLGAASALAARRLRRRGRARLDGLAWHAVPDTASPVQLSDPRPEAAGAAALPGLRFTPFPDLIARPRLRMELP
jgi:hypothetical protein